MKEQVSSLIVIAVGGTGGHLYPARVLAEDLVNKSPETEVLFLGHGLSRSPFFARDKFSYRDIPSAAFSLKKLWRIPKACVRIVQGVLKAQICLYTHRPILVVGFGSYHSLPVLIAAYLCRIPYILFEANAILGKVNKLFSKKALLTTYQLFPLPEAAVSTTFVKTILPREPSKFLRVSKEAARNYFGLDTHTTTLLVFGGSQGATTLNALVIEALEILKAKDRKLQVIHFIGLSTSLQEVESAYKRLGIDASVKRQEQQMAYAYSAADLLLSRAGANTVAEQVYHQLPAIFIPYPYLADDHQTWNARYVSDELKGGIVLAQKGLSADILASQIESALHKEAHESMKTALQRPKEPDLEKNLSDIILESITSR